jgi:hypothetical protein
VDPEQHARVEAIVRLACDCAPSERDALVAAECGDDDSLRRAVERGIERETSAPTARALRPDSLALAPGTLVGGRYRVESELGAGGMGRVYRATQIALRREVALKVLSAGPDASPSALERFEREAAAVARLRHPNIV